MIINDGKKYFTLSEANSHVAQLSGAFARIQVYRDELETLCEHLGESGFEDIEAVLAEEVELPARLEKLRDRLGEVVELLNDEVDRIEATGCVVKDLDAGLVDFYSRREGEDILLCWQYGEPEILFWHSTHEGFAGRRPVEGLGARRRLN